MPDFAAVSYKIDLASSVATSSFLLQFASCCAGPRGISISRAESWQSRLPAPSFTATADLGYSEAKGIVGGIPDALQAAQSAVIERVIGDAITVAVCEIVDKKLADMVLLRGPAFPKTLGRLLSLRFPEYVNIAWITPLASPRENRDETEVLLRRLIKTEIRLLSFQHEYLLSSFSYPDDKPTHLIDFIDTGDRADKRQKLIELLERDLPAFDTRMTRYLDFAEASIPPVEVKRYPTKARPDPWWMQTRSLPSFVEPVTSTAQGGFMFPWKTRKKDDTTGSKE